MSIALIDDDFAVLDSLKQFLGNLGIEVIPFQSAKSFLDVASELELDCVVSDVRMPDISGLDLYREVAQRFPSLPVVLITGHGDIEMAVAAVKAGVMDFVEKPFSDERIISSIRNAIEIGKRKRAKSEIRTELGARLDGLSPRQRQVMHCVIAGLSNKEIASKLGISQRTVENYRAWVMERMGARNVADLVRLVTELKIKNND